jgi:SAM-dependent methyltransferase
VSRWPRIWVPAFAAVLGVGVSAYWLSDPRTMTFLNGHLVALPPLWLAVAALTLANLIVRWLRWHYLTRRHGAFLRTWDSLRVYVATLPAMATPFYVGELVRGAFLRRSYPGVHRVVVRLWFVERIADVLALMLLWSWARRSPAGFVGSAFLATVVGVLLRPSPTLSGPEIPAARTRVTIWAVTVGLSLVAWAAPAAAFALTTWALHGPLPLVPAAGAFAEGTLLGGITGIPLGAGVAGSAAILALNRLGVAVDAATAIVLLHRAGTTWFAVALGTGLLLLGFRHLVALLRQPTRPAAHFDALAPEYARQMPEHFRERLLGRKIEPMFRHLSALNVGIGSRGLDLGCGQGWYLIEMARRGYRMTGVDAAVGQLVQARTNVLAGTATVDLAAASAAKLPFPSESFDFVYSVNLFHHIVDPVERSAALAEVRRVLRPQGVFFLHEMNVTNPLFRFYLSYVFPILKDIDEGLERWIRPGELPDVLGARWSPEVEYFNFFPDFVPRRALQALEALERRLERSALRRFAAHYVARLQRI